MDLIADFFDMRGSCSHRASLLLGRERPADAARGVAAQLPRSPHGWRLRSRLLGVPEDLARHACEPVRERVDDPRGGFLADTLIRSCGVLCVGDEQVATPAAAAPGPLVHRFELGPASP